MWFCAALLLFSGIYTLYETSGVSGALRRSGRSQVATSGVMLTIAAMAISTFLVRIVEPMSTSAFNMQLGDFPSYIIMFGLGVVAGREAWIEKVSERFAGAVAGLCVGAAMLMWLPLLVLGGALRGKIRGLCRRSSLAERRVEPVGGADLRRNELCRVGRLPRLDFGAGQNIKVHVRERIRRVRDPPSDTHWIGPCTVRRRNSARAEIRSALGVERLGLLRARRAGSQTGSHPWTRVAMTPAAAAIRRRKTVGGTRDVARTALVFFHRRRFSPHANRSCQ